MRHLLIRGGLAGIVALGLAGLAAPTARADGLFNRAWNFTPTDRGGLAVVMRQVNGGMWDAGRNSSGVGSYNITQYVCSGDSSSASATGNSSCIILGSNASGSVNAGQNSNGDSSANSSINDLINQLSNGNN